MYIYDGHNRRPFSAVCDNKYGREVIYTNKNVINENNIVDELNKAMSTHRQNAIEIEYLEKYYEGDQPILYRNKKIRSDVNNKVLLNLAYELVERKVADICAEPIQYVLRSVDDDKKSEEVTRLNILMDSESKQEVDIDICRWRSICGTAYRFIGKDNGNGSILDESPFELRSENPMYTFVAYHHDGKPAFSCQIARDEDNEEVKYVYTNAQWFVIKDDGILASGSNGNFAIPVIEYPNNSRRLSDIEMTIYITDAINTLQSDRINGIEQFVASWIKFVNCEVDEEQFKKMQMNGALVVKSNNGESNKADVDVMSHELNQTEGQVVFDDLFQRFLDVQGLANREGNTGGDTAAAVTLRNGHADAQLRTAINEPIIKKAERMSLKLILYRMRVDMGFTLMPSDIEIHINHNKADNLLSKAEALQILVGMGIDLKSSIKTADMFGDPEFVATASKPMVDKILASRFPSKEETSIE